MRAYLERTEGAIIARLQGRQIPQALERDAVVPSHTCVNDETHTTI